MQILEQLDHVLVDVVVQDHAARAMWKKHFWGTDGGKSSVEWDEFAKVRAGVVVLCVLHSSCADLCFGLCCRWLCPL